MDPIAIGLIGCGGMGRRHLRAYAAVADVSPGEFDLTAVCDARPDAAELAAELAEQLLGRRPRVFTSHEELIRSGICEAVDVVTDPSAHHVVAGPALAAGIHVSCEKPLGITVRACQEILAAARPGVVLSTAENYRRDGPNRLARRVLDSGLLGHLHAMVETSIGGSDQVLITPWRHIRESGPMALDMGVHFLDIFNYLLGDLKTAYGSSFIAEPVRRSDPDSPAVPGIDYLEPGAFRATGDDSLVGLYQTESGVFAQLTYIPSGPGTTFRQRTLHGRNGSMSVPRDRSGEAVTVRLGNTELAGAALREAVGGFALDGIAADFFGPEGTEYDRPFEWVDAANIGLELDDFAQAVRAGQPVEVDGRGGLAAVAGVWALAESQHLGQAVAVADVASGTIRGAQAHLDSLLGFQP
ncbi:MAG TPA: Gfo/Idh/MocA family oxidoreductase [Streptosporangiaceae bacterium]|jgi:predicted dehydrogenase|nr:Gfo/Idh/MocA family oxidoreductase [Streptosporangiaceae bacterium]